MAGANFQSTVNTQYGAGIPGSLYDDSPVRSAPWILNSANAAYNIIGATAFTASSADPGTGITSGVAAAGGTNQFVGILSNLKTAVTSGTSAGALIGSATLPNNVEAELVTMGHIWAALPMTANVGDLVSYDSTTGALSTRPKTASFTASLAKATGILTVSAITAGALQPGSVLSGASVAGVVITAFDSASGGTGTYYTNFTGGAADVSSEAMTATNLPVPATSFTASVATTGVMTVTAVGSGQIVPGQVLSGTGLAANSTVQPYGTSSTNGEGSTGTYVISPAPAAVVGSETITADLQIDIPGTQVILFAPSGNGGVGVISLTSA